MKIQETRYKLQNKIHSFWSSNRAGFTLIELLLYAGLFTILLVVLLQLFTSLISAQLESEATSTISQDGQYILARLGYDISKSDAVLQPATFGASQSAMTLTIASTSAQYTLSQGNLFLGTDRLNSYAITVSNFYVTRLTNSNAQDSLTVSFVLTSNNILSSGTKTETFQTTINRRSQ